MIPKLFDARIFLNFYSIFSLVMIELMKRVQPQLEIRYCDSVKKCLEAD